MALAGRVAQNPPVRAGLGTSTRISVGEAAAEAARQAAQRVGGRVPDAAIVVATAAWGGAALEELVAAVAEETRCEAIVGGSVDGLLAAEGWVTHRPALAILALSGVDAHALRADELAGHEARAGAEWAARLPAQPAAGDVMVLFADALGLAPGPLLAGLGEALEGLPVLGVGASDTPGGPAQVWTGGEPAGGACAALVLRGAGRVGPTVTHACRVLGEADPVTRASGHWVLGLSGRPALEVLRERSFSAASGAAAGAPAGALVGLLDPGSPADAAEGLLIRNVAGFDEARGAFALPEPVEAGARLVAVELEREAAEREVRQRVGAAAAAARVDGPPACGLYLTCRGAGDLLLGAAAHDRTLAGALGGAPLLGVSGAYQIASPGDPRQAPRLHTYSGVVSLLG